MSILFQKDTTIYKAVLLAGILSACLIGLGGCRLFLPDSQPAAPVTFETAMPIEKIIELTYSAAGTQTALSYSSTPSPTATLVPTITLEPTMTLQLIPSMAQMTDTPEAQPAGESASGGCSPGDQIPYVYSPDRLVVLSACIHVTGVIAEIMYEDDGDLHIRLDLDREFEHYLKPSNPGGKYLVVEPVCVNKPTQPNAVRACALDHNPLKKMPKVGDHVWMEGRYVTDTFHGNWAEIHPLGSWGYH